MKKVGLFWSGIRRAMVRDPIMLSMLVVVVTFGGYTVFEMVRSIQYQDDIESYKKLARVQNFVLGIDQFTKLVEHGNSVIICDLQMENVFSSGGSSEISTLLQNINTATKGLQGSTPAFASAAVYLPTVRDSRALSGDLAISLANIDDLSKKNAKAAYCSNLGSVLSKSAFLRDLANPEGVSALFVGQVENFWVNIAEVQENFRAITGVPADFAGEHAQINDIYNDFAQLLRGDTNEIDAFSSKLEEKIEELDFVFDSLRLKSQDLQQIPTEINLNSAPLR